MNTYRSIYTWALLACTAMFAACSGTSNGGGNCGGYGGCTPANVGAGAPTVAIVGVTPSVSGTVSLTATVTAPNGGARVEYLVDNVLLTTTPLTTSPYTFSWNTAGSTDGGHSVEARVTDANGIVSIASVPTFVANTVTLNVALSPREEIPAIATTDTSATGSGTLTVNMVTGAATGSITLRNFRDAPGATANPVIPTAAHIHEGFAGSNGPVIFTLTRTSLSYICGTNAAGADVLCTAVTGTNPQTTATAPTFAAGTAITNYSSTWSLAAGTVFSSTVIPTNGTVPGMTAFRTGRMYFNAHSTRFPTGEMRTQIKPANIRVVLAALAGSQEVPAVTTTSSGIAALTLDTAANTLTAHVNSTIAAATGAHIHKALAGANGGIFIGLTQDPTVTTHQFADLTAVNAVDIADFFASGMYANVHTAANPGGEIRGQIVAPTFIASMNSANEVPPTAGAAYSGSLTVNYDPVSYQSCIIGVNPIPVTDTVSASHIHRGVAGANGAVVVDYGTNLSNTCVLAAPRPATATAPAFDFAQIIANPAGFYYNIHTVAYPGGALRGQLVRGP